MATALKSINLEEKKAKDIVQGNELEIDGVPWKVHVVYHWCVDSRTHIECIVQPTKEHGELNTCPKFQIVNIKRILFDCEQFVNFYRKEWNDAEEFAVAQ